MIFMVVGMDSAPVAGLGYMVHLDGCTRTRTHLAGLKPGCPGAYDRSLLSHSSSITCQAASTFRAATDRLAGHSSTDGCDRSSSLPPPHVKRPRHHGQSENSPHSPSPPLPRPSRTVVGRRQGSRWYQTMECAAMVPLGRRSPSLIRPRRACVKGRLSTDIKATSSSQSRLRGRHL